MIGTIEKVDGYASYVDATKKKIYPIKKVNNPGSKFSKARYMKGAIPEGATIEIRQGVGMWALYYAWENKVIIHTTIYTTIKFVTIN